MHPLDAIGQQHGFGNDVIDLLKTVGADPSHVITAVTATYGPAVHAISEILRLIVRVKGL
jgi:hypothetical protein